MVLTILSLVIGGLIVSMGTALLYATWLSGAGNENILPFFAITLICGLSFATLGGWLTALIAQRAPMNHAIALSSMVTTIWVIYTFTNEIAEPLTLSLISLAIAVLGIVTGGQLRLRQMNAQSQQVG